MCDSQVKKNILLRFHVGNFNFHVEKAKRLLMRGQHLQKHPHLYLKTSQSPVKTPISHVKFLFSSLFLVYKTIN